MAKGNYEIPFDKKGNQLHYIDMWEVRHNGASMYPNFEFDDTLEFIGFQRGRSAAYATFKRSTIGTEVTMFLRDLEDAMPFMAAGAIRGRFTFCKRGMNYGCKRIGDVS
jgi:hypothetical protein